MNKYKCHKVVQAAKIVTVGIYEPVKMGYELRLGYGPHVYVNQEYFDKHEPKVGGYYVRYDTGYESWSPADAFEAGYTLIEDEDMPPGAVQTFDCGLDELVASGALDVAAYNGTRSVANEPMMRFFAWSHLPPELQEVSSPFYDLARRIVETTDYGPERTEALRKLLESKDCAVRASL